MYTLEACLNTVTSVLTFRDIIAAFKLIIIGGVFVTSVIDVHLVGTLTIITQKATSSKNACQRRRGSGEA